jgi:hypothetical protein
MKVFFAAFFGGRISLASHTRAAPVCHSDRRMHDIGVTGVALERRSPEYLAKFVVDEIARWAGPIEANGLQVD